VVLEKIADKGSEKVKIETGKSKII